MVLMPDTAIDAAVTEAEKLRVKMENSQIWPGFKVTTSVGAAERDFGESLDRWFMRVDKALYKAKNGSRNQVSIYR